MNQNFSFYNTANYKIVLSLSIAIFFYFFIIFFLPFGVDNYNPDHEYTPDFLFEIFKFLIPLLLISLVNEFVLRPLFFKNTSLKNIIYWSLWTLLLLSSIVFLSYNFLGNWHDFKLESYLEFLINVSAVLIFPLVAVFFFYRYRSLQTQIAHSLTTKNSGIDESLLINFKGQGSKDQIMLSLGNFCYGKAQDNYVELVYVENEELRKFLLRNSLSKLSESLNTPVIVRCHRSYLVNLLQVNAVTGGSSEIRLHLKGVDTPIPVSKSYRETTLENLHKIKNFA